MELSNEDNLRLNVMLAQNLQAVRIDESKMIVYGLSEKGEAKVPLNPTCKDEKYVKLVKELFSTHVLGSPSGYPIFLQRWTRMGQAREESLEKLLLLGEDEAVVATVHAQGVTNEIARRAWWCMNSAANARCLLRNEAVVQGEMGKVLAEFLVEFIPFEEDPMAMMESVRLVLQPGLVSDRVKMDIWAKSKRKNALTVGFLHTLPDELPETKAPHPQYDSWQASLSGQQDNALAQLLLRISTASGQSFLNHADAILKKPANQDVVVMLLQALEKYFQAIRPEPTRHSDPEQMSVVVAEHMTRDPAVQALLEHDKALADKIEAMLFLSLVGEKLVSPIFAVTDSMGSVMRKKIDPVAAPVHLRLDILRG